MSLSKCIFYGICGVAAVVLGLFLIVLSAELIKALFGTVGIVISIVCIAGSLVGLAYYDGQSDLY